MVGLLDGNAPALGRIAVACGENGLVSKFVMGIPVGALPSVPSAAVVPRVEEMCWELFWKGQATLGSSHRVATQLTFPLLGQAAHNSLLLPTA